MNRIVFLPRRCLLTAAVLVVFLLSAAGVHGHDLWLEKCEGGYLLLYGHIGTDGDGKASEVEIAREVPVRIAGSYAVVYVLMSQGYWSETPFEMKNLPKDEAGTSIRTWLSFESVKRIDQWVDGSSSPLTEGLEIIPVRKPLVLSEGRRSVLW